MLTAMRRCALATALLLGCNEDGTTSVDSIQSPDACTRTTASTAPYYDECVDTCAEGYDCVTTKGQQPGKEQVCLLACELSCNCPVGQGCVGDPAFPIADVGVDGYCADPP